MRNPFRPSAGSPPPELIGRSGVLDAFDQRLRQGFGTPTIITGARGIGKTVMLGVAEELARSHGWDVISETATAGLAGRLRESVRRLTEDRSSVSTPGESRGPGLVITVDEIHAVNRSELAEIGAGLESFAGGLPFALVVAGLPAEVSELLAEEAAAFLWPADRIVLRNVAVDDVESSLARTFAAGGFAAPAGMMRQAAEATDGYPYLVQLVGYCLWREAERQSTLTATMMARAIEEAQKRYARTLPAR